VASSTASPTISTWVVWSWLSVISSCRTARSSRLQQPLHRSTHGLL
jgi:hypothetical protein